MKKPSPKAAAMTLFPRQREYARVINKPKRSLNHWSKTALESLPWTPMYPATSTQLAV